MEVLILRKVSNLDIHLISPIEAEYVKVVNAFITTRVAGPIVVTGTFIEPKVYNSHYSKILHVITNNNVPSISKMNQTFTSNLEFEVFDCHGTPITDGFLYLQLQFLKEHEKE